MIQLKVVYLANIIVAGWISITCLFTPKLAVRSIFQNTIAYSEVIRLVGCLWGAIFILSILGLFYPKRMALVLLFQLIYKGAWLLAVALPAILAKKPFPSGMAVFFVVWCLVLPFVIPWKAIFQ